MTGGSEFGYSVSMSGQYFVAGAPGFDADAGKCVMGVASMNYDYCPAAL